MEQYWEQLNIRSFDDLFNRDNPKGVSLMDNLADMLSGTIFLLEIFDSLGQLEINTTFCSNRGVTLPRSTKISAEFRPCIHPEDFLWLEDRFKQTANTTTDGFQFFARLQTSDTEESEEIIYKWHFFTIKVLKQTESGFPYQLLCIAISTENIVNHERKFETYIKDASFIRTNREKFFFLTSREKEVLHLLSKGYTNRQTSLKLGISEQTVKTHRKKVIKKLHTANPMELANYLVFFE
ncbi:MAG: helix-turn-helix transcriptional regulator [Bacteroidia bacterium]|nr:helix-turn-helix transcriptional regulator [Bacteroidia bacterium]